MYVLCISTLQVSLVEGIDSLEPFWVLAQLNSALTGKGSPVTRQQIDPQKLGEIEELPFEFTHIIIIIIIHT